MKLLFWKHKEENDLEREVRLLQLEVAGLRRNARKPILVIDASVAEPAPTDEKMREGYVTAWTRFHEEFLEKKLIHLIAQVREDLDWGGWQDHNHPHGLPNGMTRSEYDAFLRGTSNALKLLIDYGDQMRGELAVYQLNTKK